MPLTTPAAVWRPSLAGIVCMVNAPRRLLIWSVALVATVAACAPTNDPTTPDVTPITASPSPTPSDAAWPEPDPERPVVDLTFTVSDDLTTVVGAETVTFTPDLAVCEVVFRTWPNKPTTADSGNRLQITQMRVGGVPVTLFADQAVPEIDLGTLVEVPLLECVQPGTPITAEFDFVLTLGPGTDERIGVSSRGDMAWFGSAFPLLAWENGRGWAREPAVWVAGEMASSETFDLRSLEVVAPAAYGVLGAGLPEGTETDSRTNLTTHRFSADAVRDVTVTVGLLEIVHFDVDGVAVHVGTPASGTRAPVEEWTGTIATSMRSLVSYLGEFPYSDIWVSVVPDQTDGVEFPGAVQFGDVWPSAETWLVSHELAHMWFYGLVGNNQGRDPWLDESFATFVQMVVDDPARDPDPSGDYPRWAVGQMGRPMAFWAEQERPSRAYVDAVYSAGGDALLEARRRAGSAVFDAALRRYLVANAHTIATPDDVERALADLPAALDVLREAGAFDGSADMAPADGAGTP